MANFCFQILLVNIEWIAASLLLTVAASFSSYLPILVSILYWRLSDHWYHALECRQMFCKLQSRLMVVTTNIHCDLCSLAFSLFLWITHTIWILLICGPRFEVHLRYFLKCFESRMSQENLIQNKKNRHFKVSLVLENCITFSKTLQQKLAFSGMWFFFGWHVNILSYKLLISIFSQFYFHLLHF